MQICSEYAVDTAAAVLDLFADGEITKAELLGALSLAGRLADKAMRRGWDFLAEKKVA